MTTKLDYVDSVIALEKQAISQFDRGNQAGLKAGFESLRAIVNDCNQAMKLPGISQSDRDWFQAKHDKAAANLV